ncbi:MAG: ABC transporter permease [Phycisphaerales bacterium]
MRGAWTIAFREFRSFFRVPVGWLTVALYLFLTGVVFANVLVPGGTATMRDVLGWSQFFLMALAPAVSMRLLSEEFRSGTYEALMTSPVGDVSVTAGKFLGGVLFLKAMFAPTLLYPLILLAVSDPRPDLGPMVCGYLGLVLLGAFYLAFGMLLSSLTSNQTLAFVSTFLLLVLYRVATSERVIGGGLVPIPPGLARALAAVAPGPRLDDFAKGLLDLAHIVFFLSATAWFLMLTFVALEMRRWR